MNFDNFAVGIIGGTEKVGGIVEIPHNTEYSILLRNDHWDDADATVYIDGKEIDTFRVPGSSSITLERPTNNNRKFKFVALGTREAFDAQLEDNDDLGLIQVRFNLGTKKTVPLSPTYKKHYIAPYDPWSVPFDPYNQPFWYTQPSCTSQPLTTQSNNYTTRGACGQSVNCSTYSKAGGTGLGSQSYQQFGIIEGLNYYGTSVTISLRLQRAETYTKPLVSRGNPVPKRTY